MKITRSREGKVAISTTPEFLHLSKLSAWQKNIKADETRKKITREAA